MPTVTAVQIGSALGPRTEIYCGIDYIVAQKLEWIRDKNIELVLKQKQIERKLKAASVGRDNLLEVAAEVIVKGIIFPGAYIEICHLSYVVPRPMKKERFKLDDLKGKVIAEPLVNGRSA